MFEDEMGINADAFLAQNATNVKRKPPIGGSGMSRTKAASRKDSKHDRYSQLDPDDDFINEVTEPMKAKTKDELLGHEPRRGTSRQSSRSRSRSKSNEMSQKSGRRRSRLSKGAKMLNEQSN